MSEQIVILTGNHLCHNPRVMKEASALVAAGYRVKILGAWTDASLKSRDLSEVHGLGLDYSPVLDLTGEVLRTKIRKFWLRLVGRSARSSHRLFSIENRRQLGPAVAALARAASAEAADLFIAHSEPALVASKSLLRKGLRVAVDMEDWFSEDLPSAARRNRPIRLLRDLERTVLCGSTFSSCPSNAMSEALSLAYRCSPPRVIYNAFPWADRKRIDDSMKDRRDSTRTSILWYSQTLGEGRGLEDLLAALPMVRGNVELHLRGVPTKVFREWLAAHTPASWVNRIFVHELVDNAELLSRIAEHDIGFAGEAKESLSRNLTVTNKMLHYLLGGLAVVASDTAGQKEVASRVPGGVVVYRSGDSVALAAAINAWADSPERLLAAQAAAADSAESVFSWERQVPVLLDSVAKAFERSSFS